MVYLNGFSCKSALGVTEEESAANLAAGDGAGLKKTAGYLPGGQTTYLGAIRLDPPPLPKHDCRANRLLGECLKDLAPEIGAALAAFGPDRIGAVIGTSTSAITDVENSVIAAGAEADELRYDPRIYEIGNISVFVRDALGITGPCYTVATACSSGGRAFVSARALLEAGVCDAVIAGAADTLSRVTVSGFSALGAVDPDRCRPFSDARKGINIGEGAGLTILTREPLPGAFRVKLLGAGSSTDGYHISAPRPDGAGAKAAIAAALKDAGLKPADLGYVNLHATGTILNDAMEHRVVGDIFGNGVPVSGTKHLTGHTLGAAGVVEAYVCWLVLKRNLDLPALGYLADLPYAEFSDLNLVREPAKAARPAVMSNNFAFGGNNVSLIFGAA